MSISGQATSLLQWKVAGGGVGGGELGDGACPLEPPPQADTASEAARNSVALTIVKDMH